MAKQPKLTKILEGIFEDTPQVNKYKVVEGVRSYGVVGKTLYNNSNILQVAEQLSKIAEDAHSHVVSETDDWFDKVSVNKNMQSLKKSVSEFKKTAMESHQLNQRLTGLYEDMGHILNRYYDISEGDELVGETVNDPDGLAPESPAQSGEDMKSESLDPDNTDLIDQPADPAKDGEEMKSEGDGQDDPSQDGEEMKEIKRSLRDVGGVVGIPALGQFARKFSGK
jgi:hypothetical protein